MSSDSDTPQDNPEKAEMKLKDDPASSDSATSTVNLKSELKAEIQAEKETPKSPAGEIDGIPENHYKNGWRRHFSSREKRPYYFNVQSKESVWDVAFIGTDTTLRDPLGCNSPSPSSIMSPDTTPTDTKAFSFNAGSRTAEKRRSSSTTDDSQVASKRRVFNEVMWNLQIPTNAIIIERPMSRLLPPHPEIEQLRAQQIAKLRKHFQELCHSREGIDAPHGSFNRWLFERKVCDKGDDPLFPSECNPDISSLLVKEITNHIPITLVKPKFATEARQQLVRYAEATKKLVEKRSTTISTNGRKYIKLYCEEVFDWMRKCPNALYEEYNDRLAHLHRNCQKYLIEAVQVSVNGICLKLYHLACESAKKMKEKHRELFKQNNIDADTPPPEVRVNHRVMCYPALLCTPSPFLPIPQLEHLPEGISHLTFNSDKLIINTTHFQKLEELYKINCKDDSNLELFLARVWCLLKRYQMLFGNQRNEGADLQGALPSKAFECLHRVFDVSFECFASPLNCYFRQYCSAFADTDGYFGSRGPILQFHPISGSFEANPPFCDELMEAVIDHIETLLQESQEPLSFVVFMPEWRDPIYEALIRLEGSKFKRAHLVIPPQEHEYKNGYQHMCGSDHLYMKSKHGTLAVFLQNDAGFKKWTPTQDKLKEVLHAFRPKDVAAHT